MDLEKAYDTIDWHGMWQMLKMYEVRGKLFYIDSRAVQSFYEFFMTFMTPWLFTVYVDGVVL